MKLFFLEIFGACFELFSIHFNCGCLPNQKYSRGKLPTISSCQLRSKKISSTYTFVVTRKPKMNKNRFLRKRGPLPHPDDGLPSTIYSLISTTTSDVTKKARAFTIIITLVGLSTSRSAINTRTWTFDAFSTHPVQKWNIRPSPVYV